MKHRIQKTLFDAGNYFTGEETPEDITDVQIRRRGAIAIGTTAMIAAGIAGGLAYSAEGFMEAKRDHIPTTEIKDGRIVILEQVVPPPSESILLE